MSGINLGDDDGFVEITINGSVVCVDLYKVQTAIAEVYQKNKDSGYGEALAAYVESLGYGTVSQRVAVRFAHAVFEQVEQLKKKDDEPVVSLAFTGSIQNP